MSGGRLKTGDAFWDRELTDWENLNLKCARCGVPFREIDNIGQWKCSQHCSVSVPTVGEVWSCCGRPVKAWIRPNEGCVKADHSPNTAPFSNEDDIPLPKIIAQYANPKKQAIVPSDSPDNIVGNNSTDQVIIRRYDKNASVRGWQNVQDSTRHVYY